MIATKPALIAVLAALLLPALAQAAVPRMTVDNVSPQPVEPGKNVTVVVTLENLEKDATAFGLALQLPPAFSLLSQKEPLAGAVTVCGYCKKQNTYIFAVSPAALSGTYELRLQGTQAGFTVTLPVTVLVRGNPTIIISSGDASQLIAGTPFTLDLDVRNIGTGLASEVALSPSSAGFIPLGGETKAIPSIPPGGSAALSFTMLVGESVKPNAYALPVNVSYVDESGSKKSLVTAIGVRVIDAGELALQNVKVASRAGSPTIAAGEPFTLIARIENVGQGTAKFITAEAACSFDGGARKAYLGSLDEGEDAPAVFDFLGAPAGGHDCTLTVSYADDRGDHRFSERIAVTVVSGDVAGPAIAALVALAVIGFIVRRRRGTGKRP